MNGGLGNIVDTTTTKLIHLAETAEQIYGIQLTQLMQTHITPVFMCNYEANEFN